MPITLNKKKIESLPATEIEAIMRHLRVKKTNTIASVEANNCIEALKECHNELDKRVYELFGVSVHKTESEKLLFMGYEKPTDRIGY